MSRIGKSPIQIPESINIKIDNGFINISNGKNSMEIKILPFVNVDIKDNEVLFNIESDEKQAKSNWGTLRSLVANAVKGLSEGFSKTLVLKGVGYRINLEGDDLKLELGFSHSIIYKKPEGIEFELDGKNKLTIKGYNKQAVGQVASKIRSFRPVEPYKGKGFRYSDEIVIRKAGKKAVSAE
jgi:large subunit ribosomal protein L6